MGEEGEDDCLICSESKRRGILVALPFCEGCNSHASLTVHAACARQYLKFHLPLQDRPQVKHLICAAMYALAPAVESYTSCTHVHADLDARGLCAGRCEACNALHDTRNGLLLHKNLENPQAEKSLLSERETALLTSSPELFRCPHTFIPCRFCGIMDAALKVQGHEKVCETLDPELRKKIKEVHYLTQSNTNRLEVQRERRLEMFFYEQDLLRQQQQEEREEQERARMEREREEQERARMEELDRMFALSLQEEEE